MPVQSRKKKTATKPEATAEPKAETSVAEMPEEQTDHVVAAEKETKPSPIFDVDRIEDADKFGLDEACDLFGLDREAIAESIARQNLAATAKDGQYFLAGRTLKEMLRKHGPITETPAIINRVDAFTPEVSVSIADKLTEARLAKQAAARKEATRRHDERQQRLTEYRSLLLNEQLTVEDAGRLQQLAFELEFDEADLEHHVQTVVDARRFMSEVIDPATRADERRVAVERLEAEKKRARQIVDLAKRELAEVTFTHDKASYAHNRLTLFAKTYDWLFQLEGGDVAFNNRPPVLTEHRDFYGSLRPAHHEFVLFRHGDGVYLARIDAWHDPGDGSDMQPFVQGSPLFADLDGYKVVSGADLMGGSTRYSEAYDQGTRETVDGRSVSNITHV
jgi:hypothetical protein